MIPRLIASAQQAQRLTRMCRPAAAAARAITCQKHVPSGLLGAASKQSLGAALPRSQCSCVGSSTLASKPCCVGSASGVDTKQQTRDNSIAVSAAATLLGGHHPHRQEYEPSAEEVEATTTPTTNMFLGDENSLLGKLKKINEGVGRKRNRGRTGRPRRVSADNGLDSVQQILNQLTEATAQKTRAEQATVDGPTLEMARNMPLSCRQMDNASLMCLAAMDNLEARAEVIRRHVMDVDNVSYAEACETYKKIRDFNKSILGVAHTIPYRVGIATATAAAFASIPLCFHLPRYEYSLYWCCTMLALRYMYRPTLIPYPLLLPSFHFCNLPPLLCSKCGIFQC